MKWRLTISGKLTLGFGLLTLAYLINIGIIYTSLEKNQKHNRLLTEVYEPSINHIKQMQLIINQWHLLLKNWVYVEKATITPDKLRFIEIIDLQLPFVEKNIRNLYHHWPEPEQIIYNDIQQLINDSLLVVSKEIINILNNVEAYNSPAYNLARLKTSDNGEIAILTDKVKSKISILLNLQHDRLNMLRAEMITSLEKMRIFLFTTTILLVILTIIIAFITIRSQVVPINYIKKILTQMGKGILPDVRVKETNDEIGDIAKALNTLVKGLKEISTFSIEIGKGNFNWPFEPLSKDDILGNSLIKMREELWSAAIEEEKRKKEDEQRNWATQGIAKFSEILRQNNNNLEELSYNIISNLVNYLNANQGGIFIVEDDSENGKILTLKGCYAYNRQKFLQKQFKPGEGLIGRCYLERETIYLTDIPKDYIKITSGLGEANPTCLLVVPLMHNDVVYGIIEVASFHIFEPYQIDFVERIASSIASTISIVNINIHTTRLLEQSRKQAEEMASNEEELRQNMEELYSTREEWERKEIAYKKEIEQLKKRLEKYEL